MKWSLFSILFALMQLYHLVKPEKVTMGVDERIRVLKEKVRGSLRNKHPVETEPLPDYYDSDESAPIKPILSEETQRDDDTYKLKKLRTPSTTTETTNRLPTRKLAKMAPRSLTQNSVLRQNTKSANIALDIFYRKAFDLNMELEWLHCSELITPFMNGARDPNKWPMKIGVRDPMVNRLLHLLSKNVTKFSRAEKRSVMYQISKIPIRMYTWDINSMYAVLSTISKQKLTDFKSLKYGLKALFASWNTDLSNTTSLLLQARIFRPPCIPQVNLGSSKFVRGSTIPTLSTSSNSRELCRRSGLDKC